MLIWFLVIYIIATVNFQTSLQELNLNQTSISWPELSLTAHKLPKNIKQKSIILHCTRLTSVIIAGM